MVLTQAEKRKRFEGSEVFPVKGLTNALRPTGYEAYRISPRATSKFGKQYKKIFGASISPDFSRGRKGAYGARVQWYPHGFTFASVKSGTVLLAKLSDYPINKAELKSKLLLK